MITKVDAIHPTCNVRIRELTVEGEEVQRVELHNVFTNGGRVWIRDLIAVPTYADPTNGHSNDRPMYIAVGVGGAEQTETPPGGGTYTEVVTVLNLEIPVLISTGAGRYWAQCVAQADRTDTEIFPDNYTVRYKTMLRPNEVSFTTQPTYGTLVPVSEAALFTSACQPLSDPAPAPPTVATGMIAYAIFEPIYKTTANLLEIIWELKT